jgi:hypothetical protein
MPEPLYDMRCNYNIAYHKDAGNNEYFGYAARGVATSDSAWQIVKMEYTGSNWVLKWADGNDMPDNVWDNVELLTYELLKKR